MGKHQEITSRNAHNIVRLYCLPTVEYFNEDEATKTLEKRGEWVKHPKTGYNMLRIETDMSKGTDPDRLMQIMRLCFSLIKPDKFPAESALALAKIQELSIRRSAVMGFEYAE